MWPYRFDDAEHADELRIDLDPQPGVGFDGVCEAAHEVRALCAERGITAYVKTSGSKGLHIYIRLLPRWDSYQVRAAAVTLARELAVRKPDLITDKWWKEERGQRVFVDFNQNAPHKTVFGAWSARPRVGAQVSTPISWDEVDTILPDDLTIDTVPDRYDATGDPWAASDAELQDIGELVARVRRPHRGRRLRRAVAAGVPEDAPRARPRGAQPGQEEGLSRGSDAAGATARPGGAPRADRRRRRRPTS